MTTTWPMDTHDVVMFGTPTFLSYHCHDMAMSCMIDSLTLISDDMAKEGPRCGIDFDLVHHWNFEQFEFGSNLKELGYWLKFYHV